MPPKEKTPPPVPGENGSNRKKSPCSNRTGASLLGAQKPAWEQLKSLGLITRDEQYDGVKAVSSFYTKKLNSLNPKAQGCVAELLPSLAQPQAQVRPVQDFEVGPKCYAVTRLPAAKCRECGHQFQPERPKLQHTERGQQQSKARRSWDQGDQGDQAPPLT